MPWLGVMAQQSAQHFDQWAQKASQASGRRVHFDQLASFNSVLTAARFKLENDLTIILQPDGRAPIFTYQTWFRVGSKDEDPNQTGMAHLFEHLMFKATRNHPNGELDREMERRGTQTNAATWVDWTYYTESLAQRGDNLETVVEFEVDRLTGLILDEGTFRSELEVVKNERRMSVDDNVSGMMSEQLYGLAYELHPYRWPVIGSMQHLERASLQDLAKFYDAYYAPNNAVVVLTGAFDGPDTLALLAQRYGEVPKGQRPHLQVPQEPPQKAERRKTLRLPTLTPQLAIGYHVPGEPHADFAALEVMVEALFSGDNGRLYRRLVTDEALVSDIDGGAASFADPGLFEINATLRQGADPERVLSIIQDELEKVQDGLTEDEFAKARHGLELGVLDSLRDSEDCAELLGHHEINYHDFGGAYREVERCQQVTDLHVRRAASAYFRPENRTTILAMPM